MSTKNYDKYWLRSGIINIMQNFIGVFFGFGGFYLLVRTLDQKDFGIWTLYMSTITILEIMRGGLIQNALIKFLSGSEKEEHPKILSASFTIVGLLSVVCLIFTFFFGGMLAHRLNAPQMVPMLKVFSIYFILSGILTQFNCIEQANFKFNGVFVSNIIRQAVFFGYVLVCYLFKIKADLLQLVYAQTVSVALSLLVSYFYAKPHLHVSFKLHTEWTRKLFNYGKYAFGTSVSSILSGTIDQMMLAAILTPAAAGSFNVAVRIVNLIDIPTNAVATIVFPQSAKRIASEGTEAIKYLYEKSVGTILAILIPGLIVLYVFPGFVIHLIAGNKYDSSIPLLKVTLLYCLLIPFGRQFGTILDSIGKTKLTFFIVVFTATFNLSLNYFFIHHYGVIGAAYATLISNLVGFTIAQFILKKMLKINFLNAFVYAVGFYPTFYFNYIKPILTRKKKISV